MKRHFSWHHRKPRSLGGPSEARNMAELPIEKHNAWHTLFWNLQPPVIAQIINRFYLDPDYEFVVVRKSKEARNELVCAERHLL